MHSLHISLHFPIIFNHRYFVATGGLLFHFIYTTSMRMQQGIRQSNLHFLQVPTSKKIRNTQEHTFNISDEIFFKSINMSHIGKMSGQNNNIKQLDVEDILAPIQEQEMEKAEQNRQRKKRIHFSMMKDPSQPHIQITSSRVISERDMEEKGIERQLLQTDKDILILKSFQGKGKDLLHTNACLMCSNSDKTRCQLKMEDESTLQIYGMNSSGNKMEYNYLLACVNFDTLNVEIEYEPKHNGKQFALISGPYRLLFEHSKPEIIRDWVEQIRSMIKQGRGSELKLDRLLQVEDFYRRRYQTEEFFAQNCQTGDILLFEDTHFFAKAQRFFTRSDFDHVAVAIKDQNYGLLMFESMSSGVSLTPWRSVIRHGWFESIPRIVWRRLTTDRNAKFFDVVQKFVKDNLQKSYHISFAKLTANVSMIPVQSNPNDKNMKVEQQGFFCSELVATLYKQLGLLTRNQKSPNYQPACNFLPKDFTTRSGRQLDEGSLSPEYDIYFDRKLLSLKYKRLKND